MHIFTPNRVYVHIVLMGCDELLGINLHKVMDPGFQFGTAADDGSCNKINMVGCCVPIVY